MSTSNNSTSISTPSTTSNDSSKRKKVNDNNTSNLTKTNKKKRQKKVNKVIIWHSRVSEILPAAQNNSFSNPMDQTNQNEFDDVDEDNSDMDEDEDERGINSRYERDVEKALNNWEEVVVPTVRDSLDFTATELTTMFRLLYRPMLERYNLLSTKRPIGGTNHSFSMDLRRSIGGFSQVIIKKKELESFSAFENTLGEREVAVAVANVCAVSVKLEENSSPFRQYQEIRTWVFGGAPFDTVIASTIFAITIEILFSRVGFTSGFTHLETFRDFIRTFITPLLELENPTTNFNRFIKDRENRFILGANLFAPVTSYVGPSIPLNQVPSTLTVTSSATNRATGSTASVPRPIATSTITPILTTTPTITSSNTISTPIALPLPINSSLPLVPITNSINTTDTTSPSHTAASTTTSNTVRDRTRSTPLPISLQPLRAQTISDTPIEIISFNPEKDKFLTVSKEFAELGAVGWLMKGNETKEACSEVELNLESLTRRVKNGTISKVLYIDTSGETPKILSVASETEDSTSTKGEENRIIEQCGSDESCETLVDTIVDTLSFSGTTIFNLYMCPKKFPEVFLQSCFVYDKYWKYPGSLIHFLVPRNVSEEVVPQLEIGLRMIRARLRFNGVKDWNVPRISCNIVDIPYPAAHHTKAVYATHRSKQSIHILSSSGNPSTYGYGWEIYNTRTKSKKVSVESSSFISAPSSSDFAVDALRTIGARFDAMFADGCFYEPSAESIKDPIFTVEKKAKNLLLFKTLLADGGSSSTESKADKVSMQVGINAALNRIDGDRIKRDVPNDTYERLALKPADLEAAEALLELRKVCIGGAGLKVVCFCFTCRKYSTSAITTRANVNVPEESTIDHLEWRNRSKMCLRSPRIGWSCVGVPINDYNENPGGIIKYFDQCRDIIENNTVPELLPLDATSLWYSFYFTLTSSQISEDFYTIDEFSRLARIWFTNNKETLELHPEGPAFYYLAASGIDDESRKRRGAILRYYFGPGVFLSDSDGILAPKIKVDWVTLKSYLTSIYQGEIIRTKNGNRRRATNLDNSMNISDELDQEDEEVDSDFGTEFFDEGTVENEGELMQEMLDGVAMN